MITIIIIVSEFEIDFKLIAYDAYSKAHVCISHRSINHTKNGVHLH